MSKYHLMVDVKTRDDFLILIDTISDVSRTPWEETTFGHQMKKNKRNLILMALEVIYSI